MTCLEKLKQMYPEMDDEGIKTITEEDCPDQYGLMGTPDFCDPYVACEKCWNRQITEEDLTDLRESMEKTPACVIKDSGERRQFDTGAVRDIQEGKGRCDLMPLDVIAECLYKTAEEPVVSDLLRELHLFTETGNKEHLYKVLTKDKPYDRWSTMFLEVAIHFEEGAEKYGENNWKKGLPIKCYINSAVRHFLKWFRGDTDEPHDRAFCWNIICAIWTCEHKPELNDYAVEVEE